MARIEADPCVDEVLRWLTPACSLALRTTNRMMNRAWWKHVLQWLEHEMGDAGWLATAYFAWWKQASSKNAFAGQLRSRGFFDPLHHTFVEVARERLTRTLHPHLAHAAPLLQAPSVPAIRVGLGAHKKGTLVQQYRAQLQRLEWRELWEKVWETLCWMPAMWASVSYAPCSEAARVLDERIMALKVPPSRFNGYHVETAWDALCTRVLPLEGQFYARSMPRAPPEFPPAPHCPNMRRDRAMFREGSRAFLRDQHQLEPSPRLLQLYHLVCTRTPRHRTGSLLLRAGTRLHLERGRALDCLQMFDGDAPVATLVVRRSYARAGKHAPIVRRARLLCTSPRKLDMFERMTSVFFRLCGKKREECIWCGRYEPRGACQDPITCRNFAA